VIVDPWETCLMPSISTPRRRYARLPPHGDKAMQVQEMIATHPDVRGNTNDALIRCIEECYSCAQVCTSCADACLAEDSVQN
jgi:hypothetical protein